MSNHFRLRPKRLHAWCFALPLCMLCVSPSRTLAQDSVARQIEAYARAEVQVREVLWGHLIRTGIRPSVTVRQRELTGCARGWRDLEIWAAEVGDHSVALPYAVVEGKVFPLGIALSADLPGFVGAVLKAGRVDSATISIACIAETIAYSISASGPWDTDLYHDDPGEDVRFHTDQLVAKLPAGWPGPSVISAGQDSVATFTVFRTQFIGGRYKPVAYALLFTAERVLRAWSLREGEAIDQHGQ